MREFFDRAILAKEINKKIDLHCQQKYDDGHRTHLGASLIGHECLRFLWYTFRWCKHTVHSGRVYRLFQRGHREETYIIEYLRAIGCVISEFENEEKKIQHRISNCGGHFGGSLDGRGYLPKSFGLDEEILFEFKTISDKYFKSLVKEGVKKNQPKHFSQTSTYGKEKGFKYCLYVSVNKNTDEIYIEFVKLDWVEGEDCIRKAENVINSQSPPQKMSQSATFWKCKTCNFIGICHHDQHIDVNCRSCKFAEPIDGAEWECNIYGIIPKEFIKNGCGNWESIA